MAKIISVFTFLFIEGLMKRGRREIKACPKKMKKKF